MLSRSAAVAVLGFAALCLVVAVYSVGRMNGLEAALRAQPTPPPAATAEAANATNTMLSLISGQTSEGKQLAMSDAEDIARAMMQYVQDHEETFPPAGNPLTIHKILTRYISDDASLGARGEDIGPFYYTFDSKSFSSIANPATTAIGYKDGPDGRAVVLADGRIRWEPCVNMPPAMSPPTQ